MSPGEIGLLFWVAFLVIGLATSIRSTARRSTGRSGTAGRPPGLHAPAPRVTARTGDRPRSPAQPMPQVGPGLSTSQSAAVAAEQPPEAVALLEGVRDAVASHSSPRREALIAFLRERNALRSVVVGVEVFGPPLALRERSAGLGDEL